MFLYLLFEIVIFEYKLSYENFVIMKTIFIILGLLLSISNIHAQKIYGVCVDNDSGESIEYVSIGIEGVNFGTISDSKGRFELDNIQNMYNERTLVFSHISYKPYRVNITEFKKLYADAKNNGKIFKIIMSENPNIIKEVTVTRRAMEEGYLNKTGRFVANSYVHHIRPWPYQDVEPTGLDAGINNGLLIETEKNTLIKSIEFEVLKNTFPTMIFKLTVYRADKDSTTYTPLMSEPHYVKIHYDEKPRKYKCDVSKYDIYSDGRIYVALEMVEDSEEREIRFPMYYGKSFYRNMSTGIIVQQDKNIGMRVKGSFPKRKERKRDDELIN